jgi:thioredoxin 1
MLTVKDFWAPWCGPCKMMKPLVESLATSNEDVQFDFINVDENSQETVKYGIRSIPTFILEKDGEIVEKHVGSLSRDEFQKLIDKHK